MPSDVTSTSRNSTTDPVSIQTPSAALIGKGNCQITKVREWNRAKLIQRPAVIQNSNSDPVEIEVLSKSLNAAKRRIFDLEQRVRKAGLNF